MKHRLDPGRPTARAFTLIELLVVIAIISMLVAILLPALAKAKRLSLRTKCQTNLRELSRAWQAYCNDNADRYLQGINNVNINYGGKQGAIPPFRGNKILNRYLQIDEIVEEGAEVFRCPTDVGGATAFEGPHFDYLGTSYAPNLMLVGQNALQVDPGDPCATVLEQVSDRMRYGASSSKVGDTSKVIMIGDFGWYYTINPFDLDNKAEWHGEKCRHNIAFVDTHVDFVRIRKGIHIDDKYIDIPFADLVGAAAESQLEVPCE